jgi:hypothetical protein
MWERYDYTLFDADVTNENGGKLFADYKPWNWVTFRASTTFDARRYENYNYDQFVGFFQFPGSFPSNNGFFYNTAYQQLMIDNRNRWKANFLVDFVALPGLTITPTLKYQDDNYLLNASQFGLKDSLMWAAGVDATYVITPDLAVSAGYMWERANQTLFGIDSTSNQAIPSAATPMLQTFDRATVNTFTAALRYAVIPSRFDVDLRYTAALGVDEQVMVQGPGTAALPSCQPGAPANPCSFPNDTTWYQRFDATGIYTFDPTWVTSMGWRGVVKAKLRYTWERNSVANWQNDSLAPFDPLVMTQAIYLGWDNPNYNVHMITGSLAWAW